MDEMIIDGNKPVDQWCCDHGKWHAITVDDIKKLKCACDKKKK